MPKNKMTKPTAKPPKSRRPSMFKNGRTVSFKGEDSIFTAAMKAAYRGGKSFSLWMREAAEEKMAREMAAK
jgi:hypothetical protein